MTVYLGLKRISYVEFKAIKHFGYFWMRTFSTSDSDLPKFPSISEIISDKSQSECLERIKKFKMSPREPNKDNKKRAAVLIPLCIVDNELSLLYTLRRANLKRHRGQVSFPGGVEDSEDKTLEETALRETEEELGFDRNSVKLWGSGSNIFGHEFTVQPVIGFLGEIKLDKLNPSPDEVETVFTIPLNHLCEQNNFRFTQFRVGQFKGYSLPVYTNSLYRVWGITGLMTHVFLSSLLPRHYKNKLQYIKPLQSPVNVK